MRCSVVSRAGQILASGTFVIHREDSGDARLDFHTDGGRVIEGGPVLADGDLTDASNELFRQFFYAWGIGDLHLIAKARS